MVDKQIEALETIRAGTQLCFLGYFVLYWTMLPFRAFRFAVPNLAT